MKSAIREFINRIRHQAVLQPGKVATQAMGTTHEFRRWDLDEDTFIFEKDVSKSLNERLSILFVDKKDLRHRSKGFVMTLTRGNHSVAAFPLLDGRFWSLSRVPAAHRGDILTKDILCANIVEGRIELSQRDVPTRKLIAFDSWICSKLGFSLANVEMADRNEQTLDYYRCLGQEWRVRPLAWTQKEMQFALAAAHKRIASKINYFHSTRGVHFLTFPEFQRFSDLAQTDLPAFVKGLRELVSVFEGNRYSYTRLPKFRGHHEIEFFGLARGVGVEKLVPQLERLLEAITLNRVGALGIIRQAQEMVTLYSSLLVKHAYADETDPVFIETIYIHITGEIYTKAGEGATAAFDDRRTALPGATYVNGRPVYHPGCDERSEIMLANLRGLMSKDESVEYANVFEIRENEDVPIGKGRTRELVYKTDRSPVERRLVVKRLARASKGYSSYMLSRVGLFRAIGVGLSPYYLMLRRRAHSGHRAVDFYIRTRCEGDSLEMIPESYFKSVDDATVEEPSVVLALAALMGDAAAQNMAMKKFDPITKTPLFGVGKEIYEFDYDIAADRVMPKNVITCSLRGSFGWSDLSHTDENLNNMAAFYLSCYAHSLKQFQQAHSVPMADLAERFMGGFEYRTQAMAYQLSVRRDEFERFNPKLPSSYRWEKKLWFFLWALERQERRLPSLRRKFFARVEVEEQEQFS